MMLVIADGVSIVGLSHIVGLISAKPLFQISRDMHLMIKCISYLYSDHT